MEYNLNNIKEIIVTEDFLGLDKSIIGCQNLESEDDCRTRQYINGLKKMCKCLPFSIRKPGQVSFIYDTDYRHYE